MDEDHDEIIEFIKSDEFRVKFRERIEQDTWGNDLPMVYMDDDGNIVEHYKDGTIKIIKEKDGTK
jgi:hypothetical protein